MKRKFILLFLGLIVPVQLFSFSISNFEALINKSEKYYNNCVTSYYSFVIVQEKKGNKLRGKERVRLFFKKPNKQYYQFMKGVFEGLRVSYIPKRDGKDHFMAKETGLRGLLGVKSWGFHSIIKRVLYPHIYDVNQYHLDFLISEGKKEERLAKTKGSLAILFAGKVYDKDLKKKMFKVSVFLSKNKNDGIPYMKADYFFDPKTYLPLHVILYDFDGSVKAYYSFVEIKLNPVFPDSVFNLHNPPPKPLLPDPSF